MKTFLSRLSASLTIALLTLVAAPARAEAPASTVTEAPEEGRRVYAFAQAGVGLVEFLTIQAGIFLGPHLTIQGMAANEGVFGAHYGGGASYLFGHARGRRPPRHAVVVGARVMLDPDATLESHGDSLNSYVVVPVGYNFLSDDGFTLTATIGPGVLFERTTTSPTPTTIASDRHLTVAGPMFNLSAGFAF